MQTIKIAHLYYDILNLYGENGNVKFLAKRLEEQNIKPEIHFLTIDDKIDFKKYDIYYIGAGIEENIKVVLKDIMKYQKEIKEAFNDNKFFIITGNALELFGKEIINKDQTTKALNLLNYEVKEEDFRIVGEQYYETNLIKEKIVGFQNRACTLNYDKPLFNVINGTGYNPNSKEEGIHEKNFYATYLLGPLLVRNPHLCDYIIKDYCKQNNIEYKEPDQKAMWYKAYEEYIKNFYTK